MQTFSYHQEWDQILKESTQIGGRLHCKTKAHHVSKKNVFKVETVQNTDTTKTTHPRKNLKAIVTNVLAVSKASQAASKLHLLTNTS